MAVNKNFVVKNGLEVDTNTLFVDSANNRVAIGTTVPTATLDVRGTVSYTHLTLPTKRIV